MNTYDLLTVGDVTLDTFLTPSEHESFCRIDDHESLICFRYGDKIPVRSLEVSLGGNAANNSVGASRLGLKVALVTTLGADGTGSRILETLGQENVDPTYVVQQPHSSSNSSTIINYQGERTIFSYHAPRSYEFPVSLPFTPWVYLTSMGETFKPFYNHFVEWLKKSPQVKMAFNPGSHQLRAGMDAIKEVLSLTYAIYVNREEAETIVGEKGLEIKSLLTKLHGVGPKVCIITEGANGSYLFDGSKFVKAGVMPVDAYERTGAGDAFGSACISALIRGKTYEEALLWGTLNSASVIGYVGSQKGLLTEEGINEWIDRAKSSEVKVGEF